MKNIALYSSVVLASFILSGCTAKDFNPSPEAVIPEKVLPKQISKTYNVREGESLSALIKKIEAENNVVIIDKTKSSILFDRAFPSITMDELQSYIKLQFQRDIVLRKYSDNMYALEEYTPQLKMDYTKEGNYKIPDISFKVHGDFTYEKLFNMLREKGMAINVDIQNRASDKAFKIDKKVPEFSGSLESFLSFLGAQENLFVRKTDNGILLKDVDTVTYNLKLPQIKLDPALSPDGGKTAVVGVTASNNQVQSSFNGNYGSINNGMNSYSTGTSSNSYSTSANSTSSTGTGTTTTGTTQGSTSYPGMSNGTTGASGTMAPIDEMDAQLKALLGTKAVYALNKTSSTLAITGDYESIKTADKLVQNFHDIYGKSVQLEMNIYQVVMNDNKAFGIDYNMLEQELVGSTLVNVKNFSTSLNNIMPTTAGSISVSNNSGIIKVTDASGTATTDTYQKTNGVVFKYLNKFGRASVVTKPMLGTINNLPVKLDIVDSIDYVYKLNATNNVSTGSTVSTGTSTVEPEIRTLTTGFSLILHPKIEDDYVKIALKSVISDNNGFTDYSYSSGGTTGSEVKIKLKDVSSRQFEEIFKLKNNEIAVVGGYMYQRKASTKNGLPLTTPDDSALDALTSAKDATTEKVEIVMTIRARAM